MDRKKVLFIKLHFGVLAFLFLNTLLWFLAGLSIKAGLLFGLKMVLYGSGLALLLVSLRWRSFLTFYTSLYLLSPLAILLGYLADGIFGAILASFFFLLWAPPETVIRDRKFEVRKQYSGFLGACCAYEIFESRFGLVEQKVAAFNAEYFPAEFSGFLVNSKGQALIEFRTEAGIRDTVLRNLKN